MELKTIRIESKYKDALDNICEIHGIRIGEAVEAMITYFDKSKVNPCDPLDFVGEFVKLKNQLIGFIKTQEKEKLNPMLEAIGNTLESLENTGTDKLIKYFKDGEYWQTLKEKLVDAFKPQEEVFNKILNNYAKQREAQEAILKTLLDTQTKEISTRAKKIFNRLKEDLATKKNSLGYHSGVDEILKIYSKQFEDL